MFRRAMEAYEADRGDPLKARKALTHEFYARGIESAARTVAELLGEPEHEIEPEEGSPGVPDHDRIGRCGAAHAEDVSPCDGPPDAVLIRYQDGAEQTGCVNHASAVLASIERGTVHPGPAWVAGAAIEAYRRAQGRRPFDFINPLQERNPGGGQP